MTDVTETLTLADALAWLEKAELKEVQRRDLRSAAETACRWFEKSPESVPAHPVALRRLLGTVSPGKAGVTKKRIANVRWGLRRLLELMGLKLRVAHRSSLSPQWRALLEEVKDEYASVQLSRFARYCSAHHISPYEVDDDAATGFLHALEDELRIRSPRTAHREAVRLWNRLVHTLPSWPHILLSVPSYSRKYVLEWDKFHPDLVEEIEAYLSRAATSDPFDLSTPVYALKASTIATYRDRLRRFASCVVLAGGDARELRSLADLVQRTNVERGLRFLCGRNAKPLAGALGTLLATIAREHVCLPEDECKVITEIARRLRGKRNGLHPKVRERLRPLKDEANLARLFLLPMAVMRNLAQKAEPLPRDARLFTRALALGVLAACALRIGALCRIRDEHLVWSRGPLKGDLIIEFAEGELKGNEPASFPVPKELARMIRVYWSQFRPLLNPQGSSYLFCGRDPTRSRDKNCFSTQLTRFTFERLGWPVNPHLFRHIVHLVVLRQFPGAYAMVARVLTHRSIETMIRNYAHFDAEFSMRAYQRLVEDVRTGNSLERPTDAAINAYALDRERHRVGR